MEGQLRGRFEGAKGLLDATAGGAADAGSWTVTYLASGKPL